MKIRRTLPGVVLGASILSLACTGALAVLERPSRAPSIDPLPAPATVVVVDPRHPSIRIELSARDVQAPRDMAKLYRKLVRTARPSAETVVAENGRIYFRRSDSLLLRLAESIDVQKRPPAPQVTMMAR